MGHFDGFQPLDISTHALREEGDLSGVVGHGGLKISTHALREEGDMASSTRSDDGQRNFYPRPPRGGRHQALDGLLVPEGISTHALREEGDDLWKCKMYNSVNFYPRPPRGGRRSYDCQRQDHRNISTHALREEGDRPADRRRYRPRDFYPRPPRGGRLNTLSARDTIFGFLPTPSARRATCAGCWKGW